ncbi:OmpP1/FadL family transporter [Candidatus Sulfurimonas baltica]|uniref:Outer membrane protein transport protein n=1 Tax=Candidatus Sulfurimonas baltica TaxID=2740404 RepID=A0A7S7LVX2_9BACT|nr:outer membrane protein transport protein [Candidatus Sulfurimonas baltica]QOY52341.1 outer membrane protein transport protein [Candidatus Sulfurimonas baltica]
MKKLLLISLAASSALMAGGYKIPETSLNAVALSAANVAHSNGADAAYYNPANMAFMKDEDVMEVNLMYVGLSDINYQATGVDINAKKEHFLIPSLHYVSSAINGLRFGLSLFSPAGLSKRWDAAPAVYTAEEFTLQIVEINPTVAYSITDKLAVAVGLRALYSKGVVKSTSPISSRDLEGDAIDFGYNLALSYKPTKELELAVTYRSNIDLSVEGDADLSFTDATNAFGGGAGAIYTSTSSATVSVPVSALLNIAVAYTLPTKTTVEFVYEKNYWSSYSELDFNYGASVNPVTDYVFGASITKNWKDTTVYRLGVTQDLDKLTLMAGVVIDETPIPDNTLSFESPDSDSISVSFGGRYQIDEKMNIGLAALYSMKDDRDIASGELTDSNVLIISAGLEYKF